jgi:hypothetical protein
MKFYQYISAPKIEMLHQQIARQSVEREASIGFDIKLLKGSLITKANGELSDHQKVDEIVGDLKKKRLVGAIEEGKPYVYASLNLKFGGYGERLRKTSPIAFWGSASLNYPLRDYAFAMAGSRHNLMGEAKNTPDTANSHSLTDAMVTWFLENLPDIEPDDYNEDYLNGPWGQEGITNFGIANAAWLAAQQIGGQNGKFEFVAKVLHRSDWDDGFRGSPIKKIVLATPLYVAMGD